MVLGGKVAQEYRELLNNLFLRYLGGDRDMIAEIEANAACEDPLYVSARQALANAPLVDGAGQIPVASGVHVVPDEIVALGKRNLDAYSQLLGTTIISTKVCNDEIERSSKLVEGFKAGTRDQDFENSLVRFTNVVKTAKAGEEALSLVKGMTQDQDFENSLVRFTNVFKAAEAGKEAFMLAKEVCASPGLDKIVRIQELRKEEMVHQKELFQMNSVERAREFAEIEMNKARTLMEIKLNGEKMLVEIRQGAATATTPPAAPAAAPSTAPESVESGPEPPAPGPSSCPPPPEATSSCPHPPPPTFKDGVKVLFGWLPDDRFLSAVRYVKAKGFPTYGQYTTQTAKEVYAALKEWGRCNPTVEPFVQPR